MCGHTNYARRRRDTIDELSKEATVLSRKWGLKFYWKIVRGSLNMSF